MANKLGEPRSTFLHGDNFVKFWENYFDNHKFEDDEKINLYIDFPYCLSNCKYCMIRPANINTYKSQVPIYERELLKLIDSCKHLFPRRQIGQIAFGGGTASLISRPTLIELMKIIGPSWNNALVRKMEVHPRDLTDEYVDFLITKANVTNISMGIQSFNPEANKNQHRISVNVNELMKQVKKFHDAGVSVNIDLVALFDGESEKDWDIFRDDMRIVRECFNTDMFFTQVNFSTQEHYYEHSLRLRKEITEFVKNASEYVLAEERYNILTMEDVQAYLDTTYFLSKPDYLEYITVNGLYKSDPRYGNYMGFGGNIQHKVFSLTAERQTIYTYYDFFKNRWIHELMPTIIPKTKDLGNGKLEIPVLSVGPYTIPPFDPANSIYDENGRIKEGVK